MSMVPTNLGKNGREYGRPHHDGTGEKRAAKEGRARDG